MAAPIRRRITETLSVKGRELLQNPKNWREHSAVQREAIRDAFRLIGDASNLKAYRDQSGDLVLLDGHMRAQEFPEHDFAVDVLDFSDQEADQFLATFDAIGAVARTNERAIEALIDTTNLASGAIESVMSELLKRADDDLKPDKDKRGPEDDDAKFPLSPVFSERYEYVVVMCTNEIDWAYLQTAFQLQKEESYKTSNVAIGHVVPFDKFRDLWEKRK